MKKKKIKRTKKLDAIFIPVPLYRISVIVTFGLSLKDIIKLGIKSKIEEKRFTNKWKKDVEELMVFPGFGIHYGEGNSDILIWLNKRPEKLSEYATLYHELYHAVDFIAHDKNFYTEDPNSEPKAYLFEYLFLKVSEILWPK